jgi:hypothetical protein
MVSRDDIKHEHFEELGALAAVGQISTAEFKELKRHWAECAHCRATQQDFSRILEWDLPLLAQEEDVFVKAREFRHTPKEYLRRFIQRARREGIRIETPEMAAAAVPSWWQPLWSWPASRFSYAAMAALFLLSVGLLGHQWRASYLERTQAANEIARLTTEIVSLKNTHPQTGSLSTAITSQRDNPEDSQAQKELRARLYKAQQEYEKTLTRLKIYEQQSKQTDATIANLQKDLDSYKGRANDADRVRETEATLRQISDEVQRLRQARTSDANTLASQQNQIQDLKSQITTQTATIQQQRDLLGMTHDVREFMSARNLHVIDVEDVQASGSRTVRQPHGRVFYTEGKSLTFIAFDLNKKKRPANYCFKVWGRKETKPGNVLSLGTLNLDDESQNRWAMKCDDPKALAEIDSVFITLEPSDDIQRPRGQELMNAYLRATPNHP